VLLFITGVHSSDNDDHDSNKARAAIIARYDRVGQSYGQ